MPRLQNAALPTEGVKQRFHYITEVIEVEPDTLAERLNLRASQGYRMKAMTSTYGTARPMVTVIFERRLKANKRKAPRQGPGLGTEAGLHARCSDPACNIMAVTTSQVEWIRRRGTCPACGTAWPVITGGEVRS